MVALALTLFALAGISHPADDLTAIVTALFGIALVVWIALAVVRR